MSSPFTSSDPERPELLQAASPTQRADHLIVHVPRAHAECFACVEVLPRIGRFEAGEVQQSFVHDGEGVGHGAAVLFTSDKTTFMSLAMGLGIFMGPVQAASRTLAGRLSPPGMITQTYGLYAFTGKSVAFMGPIAYGAATHIYGTQQAGMFTIILFWIIGLGLLSMVEEKRED